MKKPTRSRPAPSAQTRRAEPGPKAGGTRRSLSHVGGAVEVYGEPEACNLLRKSVEVPSSLEAEEIARRHMHGFHSYPARMHPLTAQRLVEGFSKPGDTVLDPFCGSGTVLLEARLARRAVVGVDANPLAVRLACLKLGPANAEQRAQLVEAARTVAAFADQRRLTKAGPSRRYTQADMALFQPHVLLELDGIRAGIDRLAESNTRERLELVLSSILHKLSRRTSDTSERALERRIAAGYPARLFVRKSEELGSRLAEVAEALGQPVPNHGQEEHAWTVVEGDARLLKGVRDRSVNLAVTSPPYPGNYDYLEHHADRLRWLRLNAQSFDHAEIGARRRLDPLGPQEGVRRWRVELGAVLKALNRVLVIQGRAVLLLADSVVAGAAVYAVDDVRNIAPSCGFALTAIVSQARPHFHAASRDAFAKKPRREHAILLTKKQ